MIVTVACVLRSGGEYKPEHVLHLRDGVRKWLLMPHRFVCLTDTPIEGVNCILLKHNWPRWWAKLELFRFGLFDGPVLYIDLDSLIVGPLDDIATGNYFTVLRNVWAEPSSARIGSGVMAWTGDHSQIYRAFLGDAERWMRTPQTRDNWGDQGFLQRHLPIGAERWQEKFPGRVVSWRADCGGHADGVPAEASIICFGGPARPWNTELWPEAVSHGA